MKTDLRTIKTRLAIEKAFIELVQTKGFFNISLIEIAEKAMVNRNTIYIHYGSKEGIMESIIASAFAKNFGTFDLKQYMGSHSNKKKINELFFHVFEVLDENKSFYKLILQDTSMTGFLEQEAKKLRTTIFDVFKTAQKNEVGFNFLLNGIFGVISDYILFNKGTKEENVRLLTDFSVLILKNLTYSK